MCILLFWGKFSSIIPWMTFSSPLSLFFSKSYCLDMELLDWNLISSFFPPLFYLLHFIVLSMRFPTLLRSFELEVFFCFLHCLLTAGPPSICICFCFSRWKLPHSLVILSLTFIFKNEVACKSKLEGCKVDGTYWLVAFIIEWTGRDHLVASSFTSLRSLYTESGGTLDS